MVAVRLVLRVVAFLFNFAAGVFLLGVVIASAGQDNIELWAAPLEGAALTRQLWIGSIYALVATLLAFRKSAWSRAPMLLWNIAAPVSMVWAVSRAGFSFESPAQALNALYFFLAALAALLGSWLHLRAAGASRRAQHAESLR